MKVGDNVPVTLAGQVVAQATVKEMGSDTATLVVPATLVVMGIRTELGDLPVDNTGTEVIIDEVTRVEDNTAAPAPEAVVEEAAPAEPAPAAQPPVEINAPESVETNNTAVEEAPAPAAVEVNTGESSE